MLSQELAIPHAVKTTFDKLVVALPDHHFINELELEFIYKCAVIMKVNEF